MGVTAQGFRYPDESSGPDVALWIAELATDVDAATAAIKTTAALSKPMGRQELRSSTMSVPAATWTPVTSFGDGASYNVGDIGYGAGIFTATTSDMYIWGGTVFWPVVTGAHRKLMTLYIQPSGTTGFTEDPYSRGRQDHIYTTDSQSVFITAGAPIYLNAGDQVQLWLYQSSGGTVAGVMPTSFTLLRNV